MSAPSKSTQGPRRSLPVVDAGTHTGHMPTLAARWFDALLAHPLGPEPRATCDDCAMTPPEGEALSPAYFHPDTKCCTYHPQLPNFLVGGVLGDEEPSLVDGASRLRDRIARRQGVHPLGIDRDAAFGALYRASRGEVFGRARTLRCPLYRPTDGACTIWRHRNAVCATWHCRHERGAVGARVWRLARTLLTGLERQLAYFAAREAGLPVEALAANFVPDEGLLVEPAPFDADALDGRVDPAVYARRWGPFEGREEEFYRACYARVAALSFDEVRALGGAEASVLAELLATATEPSEGPPANAVYRSLRSCRGPLPDTVLVETYSAYDPLLLPAPLAQALSRFDGRPLDEVRAEVHAQSGIELDDELLERLCDFGVLVPVPG